jgi:ribosomal protein S18 acetylase RimI-like enzyme
MPTAETPRFEPVETTTAVAAADLLATAFAGGADARTARARALVGSHSTWILRGHHDVVLAALAAAPTPDASVWIIEGIAVSSASRGRGHGRRLLSELRHALPRNVELRAETDAEVVGFYAACGFSTYSLGEVYPGVERFRCVSPRP